MPVPFVGAPVAEWVHGTGTYVRGFDTEVVADADVPRHSPQPSVGASEPVGALTRPEGSLLPPIRL
jgi:hypothetical protein